MMRHVSCILLLEWSTTSQMLWVYRISVPYAQKDSRFLFKKRRGQPWEFWSLVSTIKCKKHKNLDHCELELLYNIDSPKKRRCDHHCSIMYRLSRRGWSLDMYRPPTRLRSRNKIKFKQRMRTLEGILKSPLYRGIKLWDTIPESIQRSTTKVKFKSQIEGMLW